MWKWIAGGVATAAIALAVYAFATGAVGVGVNGGVCSVDAEIGHGDADAIHETALVVTQAILAGDAAAAYAMMTPEVQQKSTPAAYAQFVKAMSAMGPFNDLKVQHLYLVTDAGTGAETRTVCGPLSGDQWVAVQVRPGLRQAHVVLSASARNNDFAITVWLLPEGDKWRVQTAYFNASSAAGRSVDDLLRLARSERDGGHLLNAAVLYAGAVGFTNRGPAFQLGVAQTLNTEMANLSLPPELQGSPPFTWHLSGKDYKVQQLAMIGIGKDIGLVLVLPRQDWPSDADVDRDNRVFLDAFRKAHPDYARVFSFVIAQAMKPDNSGGFRTIYDNAKGSY